MKRPAKLIKSRPAEVTTPPAMAVAMLIAKVLGVTDPDTFVYIAIVVAFVPAGVTWLVTTIRG